ncbi:hypothetical protein QBC34DRAFT_354167 [Podospora aff. communis PSN243]|uniref:DUF3492 domain-containing protein n=1 Tax=Podospora aff. communis PSN243 TaxID=3040156 RepID=A0AAV9GKZ5_9PEZI|nr:hypothetical protein QBC34DRAFT_354167 [Podospora aff. communis PSN243]
MASFFQPPGLSGDPVIAACNTGPKQRQVYCNRLIPSDERFGTPLQRLTFSLSIVCLAIPFALWAIPRCLRWAKEWREVRRRGRQRRANLGGKTDRSIPAVVDLKPLASIKALHFLEQHSDTTAMRSDSAAYAVPLPSFTDPESSYPPVLRSAQPQRTLLGIVEACDLSKPAIPVWTNFLFNLVQKDNLVSGIILRQDGLLPDDERAALVGDLVVRLQKVGVPVVLSCHHDNAALDQLDLGFLGGVIIENACILPDGGRRDYFRSAKLRHVMTRCAEQRQIRPGFFVGFHDRWDQRPSAAVVCRAVKLARHFEAVFEHGPRVESCYSAQDMAQPISGFEFLRKSETCELQKVWLEQKRKVQTGSGSAADDQVACLDVSGLRAFFPNIEEQLQPRTVHNPRRESCQTLPPSKYLDLAPPRIDFWESSPDGEQLSPQGCVPLTVAANQTHFDAVLETQKKLGDLEMLHQLDETEVDRVIQHLRSLQPASTQFYLVRLLIDGLLQNRIHVHKGLATGFTVPDTEVEFWGVAAVPDTNQHELDIFLSRQCPNDTTTVLHVWLGHHGVSRVHRFEEELRLEIACGLSEIHASLPLSIRAAIDRATPAEALFLLEQLQVANPCHIFKRAMEEHCRFVLLDRVSLESWNDAHSRQFLAGSVDMRQLLARRLADLTLAGSSRLPAVEGLLELYAEMEEIFADSLLFGNSDRINRIHEFLLCVYDPLDAYHSCAEVDTNADLFALLFFCLLRKAALEDVYLEATDRCPIFSQPDQAAVFCELWVLGSQCELYFGMVPRALGQIVYEKHQAFLQKHPPPNTLDDVTTGIMTSYAKTEPKPYTAKHGSSEDNKEATSLRQLLLKFSALSVFCLPAMLDIMLLTFVGRGLFMTAYMGDGNIIAACYGLLVALLLSAGITGNAGSVGNYYLSHYAYGNMIHFHAHCLSGGLLLSILIAFSGALIFFFNTGLMAALIFAAYHLLISTYLNLLGIMATMHQFGSPLTSGRTVLWRTIPLLFLSPALSTFINRYDVAIYLSVGYSFLCLLLVQYRSLCREWVAWTDNIPRISESDVADWYSSRLGKHLASDDSSESSVMISDEAQAAPSRSDALQAFRETMRRYHGNLTSIKQRLLYPDPFLERVDKGLPYIEWLLRKAITRQDIAEPFSVSWFAQLNQALKAQQAMTQGLKEHSIFMLSRHATLDVILSIGLFLTCLMDRWVSIAMSASSPPVDLFSHFTSRYAICFAMLYFCTSVMTLDATLQKYWDVRYELPDGKLSDLQDAVSMLKSSERYRRAKYRDALLLLLSRLMFIFGVSSLLIWAMVDSPTTLKLYYLYTMAYTAIIIFQARPQFNRCFTRDLASHAASIIASAAVGFLSGCVLHACIPSSSTYFVDVVALDATAVTAAALTSIWTLGTHPTTEIEPAPEPRPYATAPKAQIQPRLGIAPDELTAESPLPRLDDLPDIQLSATLRSELAMALMAGLEMLGCQDTAPYLSAKAFQSLIQMWENGSISLKLYSPSCFEEKGLFNIQSYSELQNDVLTITTSVPGLELDSTKLEQMRMFILVESMLYHTATAVLSLSHDRATHVALFIHQDISSRIDFELASASERSFQSLRARANSLLLFHLCLGIDVDKEWSRLSHTVRELIFHRILDGDTQLSRSELSLVFSSGVCPDASNFQVSLGLELYQVASKKLRRSRCSEHHGRFCPPSLTRRATNTLKRPSITQHTIKMANIPMTLFKWIGVIFGGSPNVERELCYQLRWLPSIIRTPNIWLILSVWELSRRIKNIWIYAMLIQRHPSLEYISQLAQRGVSRTLQGDRIVVQMRRKAVTGFALKAEQGSITLEVFDNNHASRPEGMKPVLTATYDDHFRLTTRCDERRVGRVVSSYTYSDESSSRQPVRKHVVGEDIEKTCVYDERGRVATGLVKIGDSEYSFRYFYRRGSKDSHDVLKAEFTVSGSSSTDSLVVFWGAPRAEDNLENLTWSPSDLVCRIVKNVGDRSYISTVTYQHRRDPLTETVLKEGDTIAAIPSSWVPRMFEHEDILLQRPQGASFEEDDLLFYHRRGQLESLARYCGRPVSWTALFNPCIWRYLRKKTVYRRVPTWWLRTELWNFWRSSGKLDALAACWMDEKILRAEPLLKGYWSARGSGRLDAAAAFLDRSIDQISAAINMDKDVSEVCMLPIKTSDLYTMGLGRDANQMTTRPKDCFDDTRDRISVIFNDTGCWPDAPGGVSNCRRDLVDGHSTIRNHVLAESANEYGIPRFQVERNVQSLKTLPLWGLDGRVPNHGLIDNLLESEVDAKISNTATERDILGTFVPLLKLFVKGARSKSISRANMTTYTDAVLGMFEYFTHKDYNRTWNSREVSEAWVEAWLTAFDDTNISNPADYFEVQKPSLSDLRCAREIFSSYFFIFSVQTPDDCPKVFQSTHHGVSSLFGLFLKHRRGATFGIWDHAILWRECCLNLSTAQSTLPIPVQSMVLAGIGLAMRLAYSHADVVLPCTPVFNPIWEAELGTDGGRLGHKKLFSRKIDPIVNGVSNMAAFNPVDEVKTSIPTVVMLSNVQFIKDIKTAILAADVIVNKWGFPNYQLLVYGARDREPTYDIDMAKLIESCKLTEHVILKGFGKPQVALEDAWLFMNSSLSEGLPLAIAEAALAGVPIVATAVGATALVLTDPDNPSLRYGEVVPPNDPTALARAQIAILAMAGPWAKFSGDVDKRGSVLAHLRIPDTLAAKDVEWLSKRMTEKKEDRRKLGLLGRQVVLRGFHGKRYLREHEQMYWVQWRLAQMRAKSCCKPLNSGGGMQTGQGDFGIKLEPRISNGGQGGLPTSVERPEPRKLKKPRRHQEEVSELTV